MSKFAMMANLSIASVAGCLSLFLFLSLSARPISLAPTAVIEYRENLGEHQVNSPVVGKFTIKNCGTSPLLVYDFLTSCACAGVEVETDGIFSSVSSVSIPSHSEFSFRVRIATGSNSGSSQVVVVGFSTNDPNQSRPTLRFVISKLLGFPTLTPSVCRFPKLEVGEVSRAYVAVLNNKAQNLKIESLSVSFPEVFTARPIPTHHVPDEIRERHAEELLHGEVQCFIEVTAAPTRPQQFEGVVSMGFTADGIGYQAVHASIFGRAN